MVTYDKNRLTYLIAGICMVLLYFSATILRFIPFEILNIDYNKLPILFKQVYTIGVELLIVAVIVFVFFEQYKKAWADLKKNHLKYFKENLKYYILGVVIMMSANALIAFLGGGTSANEEAIRGQFVVYPIFTFISAVFLAPLLEESVFRLSFRNIFKNKFLFIAFSGIIFGGIHLIYNIYSPYLPLYLIAYCAPGIVFAYIMAKTNNIFVSIGFHFMHNGILMSMQYFILIFG